MLGGASAHYLAAVGQFILVAGISFGLLCFLTSFFRFQALAEKVVAGGPGRAAPPANALEIEVARRIGLAGPSVAGPAVLLVKASSVEAGEQAGVFPALRSLVRRDDLLVELDEGEMGLVLDTERDQVVRVADRLRDALNRGVRTVENGLVKAVLHMGAATYPENGVRAGNLVAAARVVLEQAQASGEGFLLAEGAATPSAEQQSAEDEDARELLDEVTGVLQSERMVAAVPKYMARHRKQKRAVSMIYFDIDHLHRYNDHYGRAAGDAILRSVAGILERRVRADDLIGRYEGDAFLVVVACRPAEALEVAGRIIREVRKETIPFAGARLRVTVSAGVAGYPDHGTHPRSIFDAASIALQEAYSRGGGRAMLYNEAMRVPAAGREVRDVF